MLGPNKPLHVNLTFRDFRIAFGKMDANILLNYTMGMHVAVDGIGHEGVVFIDEFPILTTANVILDDDVAYISMLEHRLNIDPLHAHPDQPSYWYKGEIPSDDYREFVSSFGFYLNYLRKYLNQVYFKNGLQLPFDSKEIYTSVAFTDMAMHVFLDLEE